MSKRDSAPPTHWVDFRGVEWCSLLLLFVHPLSLFAQATTGVGISPLEVHDPVSGGQMPGFVFYPSTQPAQGDTPFGPYNVAAVFGAPEQPGAKPLVVISHGNAGSALGLHDLATHLASNGFVVATLEHPKDNFHDQSGVGYSAVLVGRPIQVSATITALLADPRWSKLIDPDRIGVAGFSAGGYTSLLLVGATPRFDRFIDCCERHPEDQTICGDAKRLTAKLVKEGMTVEGFMAANQKDLTRWGKTADPRVKAAFAMAPLSLIFDNAGAAAINRPVFLYYAQNDHILLPAENALHIKPLIRTLTGIKMVPNADHWVFIPPCSAELAKEVGEICRDPAGVDRAKVHEEINADAAEAGLGLASVVRTRVMLIDISRWQDAARAHGEVFGEIRPACTFVGVAGFIDSGWLVEIEADCVADAPA